jgi:hypothetical protein
MDRSCRKPEPWPSMTEIAFLIKRYSILSAPIRRERQLSCDFD